MFASLAAASRALTARTVHLKLFPPPRNFNEQREVLRVLERFGEVTMFRFLKHRIISPVPNAFIATFATPQSVTNIISAGPIRYRLISDETLPKPEAQVPADTEAPVQEEEDPSPQFELTISPSVLNHAKYLTSPHTNPLYGPYPPYPVHKSLVGSMLYKSVTSAMWAPGLRDWETDVERWRLGMGVIDGGEEGVEREGREDWEGKSERAVYTRAARRRRERIPGIMWGVRRFIEEGKRGS